MVPSTRKEIRLPALSPLTYEVKNISNEKMGRGIEFEFTQMYSAPPFTLKTLQTLADHFGTNEIDFDNSINKEGCETCDHGSEYGYTVQIYKITKNDPFGGTK
mgnify:CR=1 FL=1